MGARLGVGGDGQLNATDTVLVFSVDQRRPALTEAYVFMNY
jgi:hypothetical protein